MTLWDQLLENEADDQRFFGVISGIVTNNEDPDRLGRVKVKFPSLSDDDESDWARIAVPMAGNNMGTYFLPEVNDEVLVAFEQGDVDHPYVIGALWNGKEKPPADNQDKKNNIRVIKSRSGHSITFDDSDGKEKIEIIDTTGQNKIIIDTANKSISVTSGDKIEIDAKGDISLKSASGKITLDAKEVEIKAKTNFKAEANANLDLKTNGILKIKGSLVKIN